jgi:hypothetical protein
MATQKCPRCESSRVRRGYRPTSLFKKLTFRYNLLCDSCNWEFIGFAIPGTVPSKTKKKRQGSVSEREDMAELTEREVRSFPVAEKQEQRQRTRRRVKIKMPS